MLISWIVTPFYIAIFYGILVFCHIPLILAEKFSYNAFRWWLAFMNHCILWNLRIVAGTKFIITKGKELPRDRPLILVSNHESMYDVPLYEVTFHPFHPVFISKVELSRGIPSISYALRHDGSALIDRSDKRQALPEIVRAARDALANKRAICVFPEGTRARDGVMKPFKSAGLVTLLRNMPGALIVPVALSGSWELLRYKLLPIPYGRTVTFEVLEPIEPSSFPEEEITKVVEQRIRAALSPRF